MLVDPVDLVGRSILVRREWESDTWALLDRHLPRGGTLVDIGAHIGYFSLKGANKVGPEGRIIAIEPHPITSTFLRENVALNAANQVSIHQIACSDREGVLDFFSGASRNIGTASLSSENSVLYSRAVPHKYRVKSRPLDDVIAEVAPKRVDVIKADVEGAEMLVLRGAVRTIQHYKPAFVLEMRDDLLRNLGSSVSELRRFLGDLGYVEAHRLEENSEWIPR
jgi:FkbM family methyltransferase